MNAIKNIQVDNNECKYILFKIDICFNEFSLAVEIDEKGHTDRDIIFEKKRQKVLEKKLGCKLIRINTSNDLYYELGNVQTFINEFKNKEVKKLEKQLIKEREKLKNITNN